MNNAIVYDVIKENGFVSGVKTRILGEEKEIGCKVLVAADGAESLVARKAGLRTNKILDLVDSGFQYEMGDVDLKNPRMLEIYLGSTIAPRGYVWIFPKGDRSANVGIGIKPSERTAKSYLDAFIAKRDDMKNARILEINGGSIPVGGLMKDMVSNGLVGVGDAVNQVNELTGGGLNEVITAGRIAGEIISKCIKNNDVSAKALDEYNKRWWKERGENLVKVERIREVIEKMSDQQMNNLGEVLSGEDITELTRGKNILKLSKLLIKYEMKNLSDILGF